MCCIGGCGQRRLELKVFPRDSREKNTAEPVQLGTQVFAAESALDDTEEKWDFLRRAALATGAFPFAFRVIDLIRDISDFARADLNLSRHEETKRFSYTDGGVFQNKPLGLSKDLVDQSPPSQHTNPP